MLANGWFRSAQSISTKLLNQITVANSLNQNDRRDQFVVSYVGYIDSRHGLNNATLINPNSSHNPMSTASIKFSNSSVQEPLILH